MLYVLEHEKIRYIKTEMKCIFVMREKASEKEREKIKKKNEKKESKEESWRKRKHD